MLKTILTIDDSELITSLVSANFIKEGFLVVTAENGRDGIVKAEKHNPDLVLLDVMMPDMTGFEVCEALRENPQFSKTPIIMLTSMGDLDNMQTGYSAGADDYITKPFQIAELKMKVQAMLRRSSRESGDVQTAKVISVFSLRGGAGSSSFAVNLAAGLSQLWDRPSVLVDLALPTGVCDYMLSLKPPQNLGKLARYDLAELDKEFLHACLAEHETGLRLLAGVLAAKDADLISEELVGVIMLQLREMVPYIVVDHAHQFSAPALAAFDHSDLILMPITPDANSVRLALSALKTFDALEYEREQIKIIVNWTFPRAGIATEKIESVLNHPVEIVMPHIPGAWSEAINSGVPVITHKKQPALTAMLEDLAWRVSSPEHIEQEPEIPSLMWQRVSSRLLAV